MSPIKAERRRRKIYQRWQDLPKWTKRPPRVNRVESQYNGLVSPEQDDYFVAVTKSQISNLKFEKLPPTFCQCGPDGPSQATPVRRQNAFHSEMEDQAALPLAAPSARVENPQTLTEKIV
ncbi:hypothetical protein ANO14919_054910 [Xylariales sp. No.14919]|nr:hypothetical protein ANO14919_054910 [Xylariales sp. No.14919]